MKNKENLQYFESKSMKGLYQTMKDWQVKNEKRLLSTDIQQDGHLFTCIALTNPTPTEVVLCDTEGNALNYVRDDKKTYTLAVWDRYNNTQY